VYVAAYLQTRYSSAIVATSVRLWMVFILWLPVGFGRYRVGSGPHIYSTWLGAVGRYWVIPLYSATWGLWAGIGWFPFTVPHEGCGQVLGDCFVQCHMRTLGRYWVIPLYSATWGLWAGTGWFPYTVPTDDCEHNCR
jgi:hypothetical protein